MNAPLLNDDKIPRAYQRGYADFYGRDFIVTPDVLIPRPETEQIIDLVLSLAGKSYLPGVKPKKRVLPENPYILDVGTGSGCIAITIKKELPEANVTATDISEKALRIAQKNAAEHGTPISFIISHLLEKVNIENCLYYVPGTIASPDLIVANLPYVDESWDWIDKEALSYEPKEALYAKNHGLALIKNLINQAVILGIPRLILEADPCQHEEIAIFAKKRGLSLRETRGFVLYLSA